MSSFSRVIVYDRSGRAMAPLTCTTERSWILNGEGLCRITIAVNDEKVRQNIVQYGNFVAVEHDTLPLWAGVLDPDRLWGESRLTLTAWSAEHLLKFRRSTLNLALSASSAGKLFTELIGIANTDEDLRVRTGDIWYGGTPREETLDGKNIYDHVHAISGRTGYDWGLDGAFDANGYLYFLANWYEARGGTLGQQLREGTNIIAAEDAMTEQGVIVNDLMGIGDGSTQETRITYQEIEPISRGLYGLRQAAQDYHGNREMGTLMDNVRGTLAVSRNPSKTLRVAAMNKGDTFRSLRLGNTLPLYMTTVGFLADGTVGIDTKVRIIGMRYSDDLDQVALVLQEKI